MCEIELGNFWICITLINHTNFERALKKKFLFLWYVLVELNFLHIEQE